MQVLPLTIEPKKLPENCCGFRWSSYSDKVRITELENFINRGLPKIQGEGGDESIDVVTSQTLPQRFLRLPVRRFVRWVKDFQIAKSFGPPYAQDDNLHKAFVEEVSKKHPSLNRICKLLSLQADPNFCNRQEYQYAGLHYAVLHDNLALAKLLHKANAYLNRRNSRGETPVILASKTTKKNRVKVLTFLLKKGAPTDSVDKRGYTALFYAIINRNLDAVKVLLFFGAPIQNCDVTTVGRPVATVDLFEVAKNIYLIDNLNMQWAKLEGTKFKRSLRCRSKAIVSVMKRAINGDFQVINSKPSSRSVLRWQSESEPYSTDESIYLDALDEFAEDEFR